jgi:Superfamily II DNA helicase
VRAGLARLEDDAFEKEGRVIRFRRVYLTGAGSRPGAAVEARVAVPPPSAAKTRRRRARRRSGRLSRSGPDSEAVGGAPGALRGKRPRKAGPEAPGALPALVDALRRWRLGEAKKHRLPAFRILTDLTLLDVAARRPRTEAELAEISGIGPSRLARYGARILEIVRGDGGDA